MVSSFAHPHESDLWHAHKKSYVLVYIDQLYTLPFKSLRISKILFIFFFIKMY